MEQVQTNNLQIQPVDGLKDNYLIKDQFGNSHEMVELVPFEVSGAIHPAFLVDGKLRRIFVGKYQASFRGEKFVTEKNGVVAHSLDYDDAILACENLNDGSSITGFHLITNAEWAALAISSDNIMGGVRVQGNNKYGKDFSSKTIMGIHEPGQEEFCEYCSPARWLAGSGGVTTSHNGNESGIYDLNGNVWVWIKGLRLNDGEINIIPDAAISGHDRSANNSDWKAILEDGSIVEPGTEGTLKFDTQGKISKITKGKWNGIPFKDIMCAKDITPDCAGVELLKKLAVFPSVKNPHDDYFWFDTNGESVPIRGGDWSYGASAGLFGLYLTVGRGSYDGDVGFRVAFVL